MEGQGTENSSQNALERTKRILALTEKGVSPEEATATIDREDAQKRRKPSLLEGKVRRLMESDPTLSREDAVQRIAVEESEARRTAVLDELTAKEPRIVKPTCPGCGADPLVFKRLRYEFGDGVVAEVLFCRNPDCRVAFGGQIVGMVQPQR